MNYRVEQVTAGLVFGMIGIIVLSLLDEIGVALLGIGIGGDHTIVGILRRIAFAAMAVVVTLISLIIIGFICKRAYRELVAVWKLRRVK